MTAPSLLLALVRILGFFCCVSTRANVGYNGAQHLGWFMSFGRIPVRHTHNVSSTLDLKGHGIGAFYRTRTLGYISQGRYL